MASSVTAFEARVVCWRCMRPQSVCYCRFLTSIETATRIVFLQHPRERDMPIGTARMASLCLPNSELHVGVDWQQSAKLRLALADSARPAALLYPGERAVDLARHPPPGPITLVVVDGTWWQTQKLVRKNPLLGALPRYAFTPNAPSDYRIRREPHRDYVSTIEALAHALGVLERDPQRFLPLLRPFRAMIDSQIEHAVRLRGARVRYKKTSAEKPVAVPDALRERFDQLVCVAGEANAWPYRAASRSIYPDVLVHWAARRVATGETFDVLARPSTPLAQGTPLHTRLSREALESAGTMEELIDRWRSFVRPTDVVCSWGRYATSLFASAGGHLPSERIDLRQVARRFTHGKVGTLEGFAAGLGVGDAPLAARGRAGARLAQVEDIARHFRAAANGAAPLLGSGVGRRAAVDG